MGVQGVSEYEREALILSSSLGASLASFWASRKKLAALRRRNPPPPPQKTTEAARRVVVQASLSCPCGAIHLLAPYEVPKPAPSSVTASPCRLSLSPLSLRDISP